MPCPECQADVGEPVLPSDSSARQSVDDVASPDTAAAMIGGMSTDTSPFNRKRRADPLPMTVLHRFTKPGGHWAEIRERKVRQFETFEFLVFVDDSLLESQMFHGARIDEYPAALKARRRQFEESGWRQAGEPDLPS